MSSPSPSPSPHRNGGASLSRRDASESDSVLRRSLHAMTDMLSPFSAAALAKLPKNIGNERDRETRTDHIPDDSTEVQPTFLRNVRIPKKVATPVRVEGKVWFANERTWVAYLDIAVLIGTLALALFNASEDFVARRFAYVYAVISVGVLVYGWVIYQKRITMIRKRDPGSFDQIAGPITIACILFIAVLANFIVRVRELQRKGIPIPGQN